METNLKFEFNINEINIVLKGLSKLPLEESLDVFAKIKKIAEEQLSPQEAPDLGK